MSCSTLIGDRNYLADSPLIRGVIAVGFCRTESGTAVRPFKDLAKEQETLNGLLEESYNSSAHLHEIEMLNLQDEYWAEVKGLKQKMRDYQARLANLEKSLRTSRREMKSLEDECSTTETQLQERSVQCNQLLQAFQERETNWQRQTEELHDLGAGLARTRQEDQRLLRACQDGLHRSHTELTDSYNDLPTGFNQLNFDRQNEEAKLEAVEGQLEAAQAAAQYQQQACEDFRALYNHVVAEKVRNFSWHVADSANPLATKLIDTEDEIAEATKQLRESFEGQIELSAELHRQLESLQATDEAKSKKLKLVVAKQNQENQTLEMALKIAQGQRDHWAEKYHQVAEAVNSKLAFSFFERGLADRNLALQETKFASEAELRGARIRGDRAVLECAIRKRHEVITLLQLDAVIANVKDELQTMKEKLKYENGVALMYEEVIDWEMPGLRERNVELEGMLED